MAARGETMLGERGAQEGEGLRLCPGHVFGALLVVAGCVVVFLLGRTDHLRCQRAGGRGVTCELEETFVTAPLRVRRIDDVQGVRVEVLRRTKDQEPIHHVVLSSPAGEYPLDLPGTAHEDKQEIAEQVQRFLIGEGASELRLQRVSIEGWFFGGMSVLSGLVVLMYVSDYSLCPIIPSSREGEDY